jgi:peroxiredoxin
MKKFYLFIYLIAISLNLSAKDGYHIQLKLTDRADSMVYLAHYYGKPFPTIYKTDSAKLNSQGVAVFDRKEKITGGIYIILPSDRKNFFEFLLDNGDDLSITAAIDDVPASVKFKNSPLNTDFQAYQKFLGEFGKTQQSLQSELEKASTAKDSLAVKAKIAATGKTLADYRKAYVKQHPYTVLASIFNALELPEVPPGKHYLPGGKLDSSFAYTYYRAHYWDAFNFNDDRLIHTPLLQARLDEYFNKLIYPQEDSVIIEADTILHRMRPSENLFKFTLNWLSTNAQTSKIMGMDKVFVHLVDNYYMKGDATWLSTEELNKYIERAKKIAPNVINSPAPELKALDLERKPMTLYEVKSKYTLLIFYSPDCHHCQQEIPRIDSLYKAVLKDKGVKIVGFNVDDEEAKWRAFIQKHKLEEWLHMWDPKHTSRYWALYDVNVTPSMYLLDEEKIIRGKKLEHTTIPKVLDMIERKEKTSKL